MIDKDIKGIVPHGATHYLVVGGRCYYYKLKEDHLYFFSPAMNAFGLCSEKVNGVFHNHEVYDNLKIIE